MTDTVWIKRTNGEAIVKVIGYGEDSGTVNLVDLINSNVEAIDQEFLDDNGDYKVTVIGATWSGENGTTIRVQRDGYNILNVDASNAGNINYYSQGQSDSTADYANIDFYFSNNGQVTLTLRKVGGWKPTTEYATYGAYDNERIIGPLNISGTHPEGLNNLPIPGSGSYNQTFNADTSEVGTPYTPDYYFDETFTTVAAGLKRVMFHGNFSANPNNGNDVNFCRNNPAWYNQVDTYVGFGQQELAQRNYTFEWTGWFRAPVTGTYNFYMESDDDAYFWLGNNALYENNSDGNQIIATTNNSNQVTNSIQMTAGYYYPVRIQYGEFSGAEKFQLYWALVGDDYAWAGSDGGQSGQGTVWYHNTDANATDGIQ